MFSKIFMMMSCTLIIFYMILESLHIKLNPEKIEHQNMDEIKKNTDKFILYPRFDIGVEN